MPGRRAPRLGTSSALNRQTRAVFDGGLDGYSYLPSPIDHSGNSKRLQNDGTQLLFWEDTYSGNGKERRYQLTFFPEAYSERVFVDGMYAREGTSLVWYRSTETERATVEFAVPPAAGARIVVEYAYYQQIPAELEVETYGCIGTPMRYPRVSLPDAATITFIGSDTGAHPERNTYTPTADGMPASLQPEGDPFHGGFARNDNAGVGPGFQMYAGPSIVSGYAHSWAAGPLGSPEFKTFHGRDLSLWGGDTEPRWHTASYLRYNFWAKLTNYKKALPTDPTGGVAHDVQVVLGNLYTFYQFTYNPHQSKWTMYANVYRWGDPDAEFNNVPVSVTVDPYDLATHKYEIAIDPATLTVTFTVDSQSWSMTDPFIWPSGEDFETYHMRPAYLRNEDPGVSGGLYAGSYGSLGGQYAILQTAGEAIESDVVWCEWI